VDSSGQLHWSVDPGEVELKLHRAAYGLGPIALHEHATRAELLDDVVEDFALGPADNGEVHVCTFPAALRHHRFLAAGKEALGMPGRIL
jgi:hypothetical protein